MKQPASRAFSNLFNDSLIIPQSLTPSYLPGLDGLRALAIIIVIAGHLFMGTAYANSFIGSVGVDVFFVISGFLITTLLLKEKVKTGKISLKGFYMRRVLRIIPVAYLYILVVFVLNIWLRLDVPGRAFLSSMFFVQNIPRLSGYNWYVEHYWSLSVEEQFYLTFPFLLAYSTRKYTGLVVLLIIGVVLVEYLAFNNVGIFKTNAIVHLLSFIVINLLGYTVPILIGSLFAVMLFKGMLQVNSAFLNRYLGLVIFILALLIRVDSSLINIPYSRLFIFPVMVGFVIVLNLNIRGILTQILSNRVLVYIGKLSYSLYIWQQLFSNPAISIGPVNSIWLRLLLIVGVSMASYHLYETKFLLLRSRFKAKVQQ